jgi:hypothetical protein
MASNINKETVNLLFDKLAKLFNYFFPGMVILELFFHKGLFSNSIMNLPSFILFIVWAGIFSVPYNFRHPNCIENFTDNFKTILCKKNNLTIEQLDEVIDKEPDTFDHLDDIIELGYILIMLLITYLVYKVLLFYNFPANTIINIPINIIQLLITFPLTYLLSNPFGRIYAYMCRRMVIKIIG